MPEDLFQSQYFRRPPGLSRMPKYGAYGASATFQASSNDENQKIRTPLFTDHAIISRKYLRAFPTDATASPFTPPSVGQPVSRTTMSFPAANRAPFPHTS